MSIVVCSVAAVFPATVRAQAEVSRRELVTPGLVLETGFRTGSCDFVRFTPDGRYVYAGGDDKVIRTWRWTGSELTPIEENPPPGTPQGILRWPSFRERRGAIFASALSPDIQGKYLAIGGYGLRDSQLAVLERATGEIQQAVPYLKGADGKAKAGTIWSIAYSPNGKQVACGTHLGDVWTWDLDGTQTTRYLGTHPTPKGSDNFVLALTYLSANRLVSVDEYGQVREWNPNQPGAASATGRSVFHLKVPGATRFIQFAISADHKTLVAAPNGANRVVTRPLSGDGAEKSVFLPLYHYPRAVALDSFGKTLAVAVHEIDPRADFHREMSFKVYFADLTAAAPKLVSGPSATYRIESLAFHPDGDHVVFSGGNEFELGVWSRKKGQMVFSQANRAPGRSVWGIGLSADGKQLAYQDRRRMPAASPNERGEGAWRHFDLEKRRFVEGASAAKLHHAKESYLGWKIITSTPKAKSASQWFAQSPKGKVLMIPLDENQDSFPSCYTFLPTSPPRIVVGHLWGASVFELREEGLRRLRLLNGHDGVVVSLAITPDGKRLVTGSRDQTICGWSLEDWPSHPQLGAQLSVNGGKLLVGEVDLGSPVWEAGLSKGDEIVLLALDGKLKFNHSGKYGGNMGTPTQALDLLQQPEGGKEIYLGWKRAGSATVLEQLTNIKDRPIWRFFPTKEKEWVLWRWQDYYYDTSTNGDFFVGWHANQFEGKKGYDVTGTPRFFRAEQFKEKFHKPAMVSDALASWSKSTVERGDFKLIEPPLVAVQVDKATEASKLVVNAKTFGLSIEVAPNTSAANQQLEKVVLWINDYRHMVWDKAAVNRHLVVKADAVGNRIGVFKIDGLEIDRSLLRRGPNRILVQGVNKADVRGDAKALTLVNPLPRAKATMHGLMIGVGKYRKSNPRQRELSADYDAEVLSRYWEQYGGNTYAVVPFTLLQNDKATPKAVGDALDRLVGKVKPDDLLIFHLGGHGLNLEMTLQEMKGLVAKKRIEPADYNKVKQNSVGLGQFVFVCATFDLYGDLQNTVLNLKELYDKLVHLPCHKLIFLDACHAGSVNPDMRSGNDLIRALTREGVGPVIISACRPDQFALEVANQFFKDDEVGGVFSQAILNTLTNEFDLADRDKDGLLNPEELFNRLESRIPAWLDGLRNDIKKDPDPKVRALLKELTPQNPVSFLPVIERNLAIAERKKRK